MMERNQKIKWLVKAFMKEGNTKKQTYKIIADHIGVAPGTVRQWCASPKSMRYRVASIPAQRAAMALLTTKQ